MDIPDEALAVVAAAIKTNMAGAQTALDQINRALVLIGMRASIVIGPIRPEPTHERRSAPAPQ